MCQHLMPWFVMPVSGSCSCVYSYFVLLMFPILSPVLCSSVTVTHWVVVTHIVNPSHFYIRYVAEKREIEALSKKINSLSARDSCHFASSDALETGVFDLSVSCCSESQGDLIIKDLRQRF